MTKPFLTGLATIVSVASSIALGAPAMAGEPGSLSYEGFLELEYLNGEFDDTALVGDVWVRFTSPTGLGFDAGLVAITDFDDTDHAIYAAVTWSFGDAKISVGVPRPAYNTFGNFPAVGGMQSLRLATMPINGSIAEQAYLFGSGNVPLGVRYDGNYGRLQVAASVLRFDDLNADDYALALRFAATSNIAILADWERFAPAGAADTETGRFGAELTYSAFHSGLAYFRRDIEGPTADIDGTETWVTYAPTPEISMTATGLNTNVYDVLGLSLRYERAMGDSQAAKVYGQIGAADGRNFDTTFDLSVGLQF